MIINVTREVMYKMQVLSEYKDEVAAWILGESKDGTILIDDLIIPTQEVGGASVEIGKEGIIDTIKNHKDKLNKILGHFHSHNTMSSFWSTVDDNNMDLLMRRKKYFIFVVMSFKDGNYTYKCKIRLNEPFKIDQDCQFKVLNPDLDKIREKINKEIEKKATKIVTPEHIVTDNDWYNSYGKQTGVYDNRFMGNRNILDKSGYEDIGVPKNIHLKYIEELELDLITEIANRHGLIDLQIRPGRMENTYEVTIGCPSKSKYKRIKKELSNEGIYEGRNPLNDVKALTFKGNKEEKDGDDEPRGNYPSDTVDY